MTEMKFVFYLQGNSPELLDLFLDQSISVADETLWRTTLIEMLED